MTYEVYIMKSDVDKSPTRCISLGIHCVIFAKIPVWVLIEYEYGVLPIKGNTIVEIGWSSYYFYNENS